MDYRQLQLFLATAERLNLSHAAEAMNITQPGLSKSMHRLQRELGTKLYSRRGRGIELTEFGPGAAAARQADRDATRRRTVGGHGHRRREIGTCPHRRRPVMAVAGTCRSRSAA